MIRKQPLFFIVLFGYIHHSSLYLILSIHQFNFVAPKLDAFPERQTIAHGTPTSFYCVATGHMLKGIKWVREGKDKFDSSTVSYTQILYMFYIHVFI